MVYITLEILHLFIILTTPKQKTSTLSGGDSEENKSINLGVYISGKNRLLSVGQGMLQFGDL